MAGPAPVPPPELRSVACPTCRGARYVEKLGLFGFKIVKCPSCKGRGRL